MSAAQPSARIPLALQQVFVSSQRGDDVKDISAPSNGMGFKVFGSKKGKGGVNKNGRRLEGNRAPFKFSSMFLERLGTRISSAADATRRAMKRKKPQPHSQSSQGTVASMSSTHSTSSTSSSKSKSGVKASLETGLDKVLKERGYSTKKYSSLDGGYHCRPTQMQQASYGTRVTQAVRTADEALLKRLLDAGLSANPCNHFGESLIHLICRRGEHKLLQIMLEAGCSLQVTDDYGRTPLHDACWGAEPSFETVMLILESDKRLIHMADCRGATPLVYVKKENYRIWVDFLQSKLDHFWAQRDLNIEGEESPPALTLLEPHALPIPDPDGALPLELAEMVANGRLEPEEAMGWDEESSDEEDSDDEDSYGSDSDSEYDSDDDSYDSDESDIDEDEMAEICMRAGGAMAVARKVFEKEGQNGNANSAAAAARLIPVQIANRSL